MRIMVFVLAGLLILSGCVQMTESVAGELQTCLSKCSEVCDLVKKENIDLEGFNQIGLEKQQGSVSVNCACLCI